ncbi:MAG: nucleoside kinase [Candidatus Symbiothrix sp.]|jgi:uridine kinase|nr:nucleoside kinase [Candidatus Symbiothrix sp.]
MKEKVRIYCKNNDTYRDFNVGVSLLEIYQAMNIQLPTRLTCARVNNKTERLYYTCYNPKTVEFIGMNDPSGMRTYVRSLCFVLAKAAKELYPDRTLWIEHSLSKGYYCTLDTKHELTTKEVESIEKRMQEIIDADYPFQTHEAQTEEVIRIFLENGMEDKAVLLKTVGEVYSKYNSLDGYINSFYGALLPSTKWIYLFKLQKYNDGLLLRVPNPDKPEELQPFVMQKKMLAVFQELLKYQKTMNQTNVGDLNQNIEKGRISQSVKVSEALQERQVATIADEIYARYKDGLRVVLIAGPSSSGKTTFCRRLEIELLVKTLYPLNISLDDYYVNRVDTPLDENGEYDYESLYAIDLQKFNADLEKILAGEEVALPTYDFPTGERVYRGNKVQLQKNSVIVMEGIHAMNPTLLPNIDPATMYKVYVSALTSISLDHHNWVSTTDNRLIRRIVRDYQFRNYSAIDTISRWPSVRRGEDKWIFPYQENADATFNSAMLYELAALRRSVEPMLKEVPPMAPEYTDAYRLLRFLRYFNYIDVQELPNTSLLREFIGGSLFKD